MGLKGVVQLVLLFMKADVVFVSILLILTSRMMAAHHRGLGDFVFGRG